MNNTKKCSGAVNSSKNNLNGKISQHFKLELSVCLTLIIFASLFYYLAYFCYYSWVQLYFLVLFMGLTVLFLLTFTYIYSIFNKKFSISAKYVVPKWTLSVCSAKITFTNFAYFRYYLWVPLYFLVLFIGPTVLFQLIFTFIYNIFNKISEF